MLARYDAAEELALETAKRACERLTGLGTTRRTPWSEDIEVAVFNPSPHPRTDVVRFPVQGFPPFDQAERHAIHPLNWANMRPTLGFEVDGKPARLVAVDTHDRVRIINEQNDYDVEFVADDVPPFGYKTFRLTQSEHHPDTTDDGRTISAGDVSVVANDDGTIDVTLGATTYRGLLALESVGDRGDSYDFDPVAGDWKEGDVEVSRTTHASGVQTLRMKRYFAVPILSDDRTSRSDRNRYLEIATEITVAPGIDRVDLHLRVHNEGSDHRVRMLFPTGAPVDTFEAATTLDIATRSTAPRDGSAWLHPAPATFPNQGWVHANGLTVGAPGLVESEVTPEGVIAITLLRCVGWLSRMDLETRPSHAGPALPTPGAQCLREFEATLSLFAGIDPRRARDAELGLLAVPAGAEPILQPGTSLVAIEPRELLLTALKPADHQDGFVFRVLNPTDDAIDAHVRLGLDVAAARFVRLDETPTGDNAQLAGRELRFDVPSHALRTVLLS
jgi:mannosylglycerate hydrolase